MFTEVRNTDVASDTLLPEVGNEHLFRCERSLLAVNEYSCSTEAINTSVALEAPATSLSVLEAKFPVRIVNAVNLRRGGIMII